MGCTFFWMKFGNTFVFFVIYKPDGALSQYNSRPTSGDIFIGKLNCVLLGFPSWCPKSTRPMYSCFQGNSCENLMMYGELYHRCPKTY